MSHEPYEHIFESWQIKIVETLARKYVGSTDMLLEDLKQELFIKLYTSLGAYRPENETCASASTFYYQVLRRHVIDLMRFCQYDKRLAQTKAESLTAFEQVPSEDHPDRHNPEPTDSKIQKWKESERIVDDLLNRLTPEQRAVAVLRMAGLSKTAIGEVLGIHRSTVHERIRETKERLHLLDAETYFSSPSDTSKKHLVQRK